MKITLGIGGCTLHREQGDKRIAKESTVVFHMRNLLNAQGRQQFRRIYPDRYGLTSCRLGLANKGNKVILWHERYAIENAAKEFNKHGKVFFMAVTEPHEHYADMRTWQDGKSHCQVCDVVL